jgi:predicted ribosomally synthesized six-cysteine peptide SCIFF
MLNLHKQKAAFSKGNGGTRSNYQMGDASMKRIKTLETRSLCESAKKGGCGECQTSCQSACKTSCGVANQKCEQK